MIRALVIASALFVVSCGPSGGSPGGPLGGSPETSGAGEARKHADAIVSAAVGEAPAGAAKLRTEAEGCKDKAEAERFVAAANADDPTESNRLWAEGMKDQRCRGFASGLPVTVQKSENGWACVIPADDPGLDQCIWIVSSAL